MLNKDIERQISQIYNKVYNQVFNRKNLIELSKGVDMQIQQNMIQLQQSNKYEEFAKKFSIELAKKGLNKKRGIWRKYYDLARKLHIVAIPSTYQEYEYQNLSNAVKHNFEMINSIPTRMLEILTHKYTSTLIEEVAKGKLGRGAFAKQLASHGHKHAKLIARTETAKLQTAITESRCTSLGLIAYFWRSSKDKRTRPSHREMDGVIVFWRPDSQKPLLDNMRGNAGEFPNCRCDAEPIIDINDLTQSTYKVYDYRIDKIITMYRYQIKEALAKGEL